MGNWVIIYRFTLPSEAHVVKGRLEAEGIPVVLKDEMTVQVYNFYSEAIGGVKLQVMKCHVAEAKEILENAGYNLGENLEIDPLMFDKDVLKPGKWNGQLKFAAIFLLIILALLALNYYLSK